MKEYVIFYDRPDAKPLDEMLNEAAREGYRLHSVVPGFIVAPDEYAWPSYVMERDTAATPITRARTESERVLIEEAHRHESTLLDVVTALKKPANVAPVVWAKIVSAELAAAQTELKLTDEISAGYKRVLDACPECAVHGPGCVPHAVDWIRKTQQKLAQAECDKKNLERGQDALAKVAAKWEAIAKSLMNPEKWAEEREHGALVRREGEQEPEWRRELERLIRKAQTEHGNETAESDIFIRHAQLHNLRVLVLSGQGEVDVPEAVARHLRVGSRVEPDTASPAGRYRRNESSYWIFQGVSERWPGGVSESSERLLSAIDAAGAEILSAHRPKPETEAG